MKDFLSIRDLDSAGIARLLELAAHIKSTPSAYAYALKGRSLAMIFEKPSLRTRVTFDVAMYEMGGHALYLGPSEVSLGKRESAHDVAKNLEGMVDGIMLRTFAHANCEEMARHACIPVINALSDYSHPCQAMADYLTMFEVKGRVKGLKVAFLGDGNNVARSLMFAGALLGAEVFVATPPGYAPDNAAMEWAKSHAAHSGGMCVVTQNPQEAAFHADVVYTDVWASMGQESEAAERARIFHPFQVNAKLFGQAKQDAIFLHCLPAHRGHEVTDEVMDSPRSFVFQQAENRLHAQKAILYDTMYNLPERSVRREAAHAAALHG